MADGERLVMLVGGGAPRSTDSLDLTPDAVRRGVFNSMRADGPDHVEAEAGTVEFFDLEADRGAQVRSVALPPVAVMRLREAERPANLRLLTRTDRSFDVAETIELAMVARSSATLLHDALGDAAFEVAIVSEGYAEADEAAFDAASQRLADGLLAIEPYRSCRDRIRVRKVFIPSPDSGVTETRCRPPSPSSPDQHSGAPCNASGRQRTTLFGTRNRAHHDLCRLICGSEARVREVLADEGVRCDAVLVLIHTDLYGGAGASATELKPLVTWVTDGELSPRVAAHELAHALQLQDEYADGGTGLPDRSKWVNISDERDPLRTPWRCMVSAAAGIGTVEGAGHQATGRFRPTQSCAMRTITDPFCAVCTRHLTNRLNGSAAPICP